MTKAKPAKKTEKKTKQENKKSNKDKISKGDFIEVFFTGKIKNTNEIFDSNIKSEIEKIDPSAAADPNRVKPLVFALGQGMFLPGIEEFLINKKTGEYQVDLTPDKAFGKRDPKLIQTMSLAVFKNQKTNPYPGAVFNFDGKTAKVLSVSGGRVTVDFNHLLAGKEVEYKIELKRKITDLNEKVKAIMDFLFRRQFAYSLDKKSKKLTITLKKEESQFQQFILMFKEKFKEILDLELEVKLDIKEESNNNIKNNKKEDRK
jgi:FKBP-type peptidyl-prolyl cis-trans isomerase 2